MDKAELLASLRTIKSFSLILLTLANIARGKPSNHIVNPHPFTYVINNAHLCDHSPDTLIWIHTAPTHYRHRTLIRETWANPSHFKTRNTSLVFFLGKSENTTIQRMIEYESDNYHDIVQETFIDSYRNLTYKAIAGCKWTSTYCKSAKLILKADDDMVIDIFMLFRHIDTLQLREKVITNTILCDVWYRRRPERDSGKWKIAMEEYSDEFYPPYCPGLGLIMTGDIIPKLYNESLYEPFFWVDDVYFTGLLGKTINVTFEQMASSVHFGPSTLIQTNTIFQNQYKWMFYHIQRKNLFQTIWEMIYNRELLRLQHHPYKRTNSRVAYV